MYLIIHETLISNLKNILKSDKLFKSSTTACSPKITKLQGKKKRRLASNPRVSLTDPDFSEKYDEVDGVYFRLFDINTPVKLNYNGDCVLVFSNELLVDSKFVLNTEENFGFCIAEDGVRSEAQFSGEEGMTITNLDNLKFLEKYKFNYYNSEILIMDDVDLKYLRNIFVKKEYMKRVIKIMKECDIQVNVYSLN